MKYFKIKALVLSLILASNVAFAQENPLPKGHPAFPTDEQIKASEKEPHKDLNKYVDIGLMLLTDTKLTDEQRTKYINEKARIEKELGEEERGVANATISYRFQQLRKKEPKRELPPELADSLKMQRKALEIQMKGAMQNAGTDEEKKLIENMYKEKILQFESQFR